MTDFVWTGLPEIGDAMFNHRVKEVVEMLTTQRGATKTTLPGGLREAIDVSKREAIDQAVLEANTFISQQDGDGVKTEFNFVNTFDWFKYGAFKFIFEYVGPSGGASPALFCRISFDSGVTWVNGATDYYRYYVEHPMSLGGVPVNTQANGSAMRVNNSQIGRYLTGELQVQSRTGYPTGIDTTFHWHVVYEAPPPGITILKGHLYGTHGFGTCTAVQLSGANSLPINGVKFFFSGNPVFNGKIQMIGIPRG